eukprot:gene10199-8112_t
MWKVNYRGGNIHARAPSLSEATANTKGAERGRAKVTFPPALTLELVKVLELSKASCSQIADTFIASHPHIPMTKKCVREQIKSVLTWDPKHAKWLVIPAAVQRLGHVPPAVQGLGQDRRTGSKPAPSSPQPSHLLYVGPTEQPAGTCVQTLCPAGTMPAGMQTLCPAGTMPAGMQTPCPAGIMPAGMQTLCPAGTMPAPPALTLHHFFARKPSSSRVEVTLKGQLAPTVARPNTPNTVEVAPKGQLAATVARPKTPNTVEVALKGQLAPTVACPGTLSTEEVAPKEGALQTLLPGVEAGTPGPFPSRSPAAQQAVPQPPALIQHTAQPTGGALQNLLPGEEVDTPGPFPSRSPPGQQAVPWSSALIQPTVQPTGGALQTLLPGEEKDTPGPFPSRLPAGQQAVPQPPALIQPTAQATKRVPPTSGAPQSQNPSVESGPFSSLAPPGKQADPQSLALIQPTAQLTNPVKSTGGAPQPQHPSVESGVSGPFPSPSPPGKQADPQPPALIQPTAQPTKRVQPTGGASLSQYPSVESGASGPFPSPSPPGKPADSQSLALMQPTAQPTKRVLTLHHFFGPKAGSKRKKSNDCADPCDTSTIAASVPSRTTAPVSSKGALTIPDTPQHDAYWVTLREWMVTASTLRCDNEHYLRSSLEVFGAEKLTTLLPIIPSELIRAMIKVIAFGNEVANPLRSAIAVSLANLASALCHKEAEKKLDSTAMPGMLRFANPSALCHKEAEEKLDSTATPVIPRVANPAILQLQEEQKMHVGSSPITDPESVPGCHLLQEDEKMHVDSSPIPDPGSAPGCHLLQEDEKMHVDSSPIPDPGSAPGCHLLQEDEKMHVDSSPIPDPGSAPGCHLLQEDEKMHVDSSSVPDPGSAPGCHLSAEPGPGHPCDGIPSHHAVPGSIPSHEVVPGSISSYQDATCTPPLPPISLHQLLQEGRLIQAMQLGLMSGHSSIALACASTLGFLNISTKWDAWSEAHATTPSRLQPDVVQSVASLRKTAAASVPWIKLLGASSLAKFSDLKHDISFQMLWYVCVRATGAVHDISFQMLWYDYGTMSCSAGAVHKIAVQMLWYDDDLKPPGNKPPGNTQLPVQATHSFPGLTASLGSQLLGSQLTAHSFQSRQLGTSC